MKVLVLGSTGYIGRNLLEALKAVPWAEPTGASRYRNKSTHEGIDWLKVDTCNAADLASAMTGFDAVVNCVAGDRRSIADGALNLSVAAAAAGCRRIVHMSTMSVYGGAEGLLTEDHPLLQQADWYGQAKRQAEMHIATFAKNGGEVVIFRPGCVFGPGSESWVGRMARWLKSGRLGDVGAAGDGWSNLVYVDDVCQAILAALRLDITPGQASVVFNLSAPDSPRWNRYFIDLAVGIGATPVRRIAARQLRMDALLAGPPLKIAEKILKRAGKSVRVLPDPMSRGVVSLWGQQIRLDSTFASQKLGLGWTPYSVALETSACWFSNQKKVMQKPPPHGAHGLNVSDIE